MSTVGWIEERTAGPQLQNRPAPAGRRAAPSRPAGTWLPPTVGADARLDTGLPSDGRVDVLAGTLARAVRARPAGGPPTHPLLQRAYFLASGTGWTRKTDAYAELARLDQEVTNNAALADVRAAWQARSSSELVGTLKRMMADPAKGSVGSFAWEAAGWPALSRNWRFATREQAARAVLGEFARPTAEATEAALARQVLGSGQTARTIRGDIATFGQKILNLIGQLITGGQVASTFADDAGEYGYYYNSYTIWGGYKIGARKALADAIAGSDCDLVKAMAAIHDICSAFYERDANYISVPGPQRKASSPGAVEDIDAVRQNSTMVETTSSMKYVRSQGMMVDHGPSYTTGRLMQLGVRSGATDREKTAGALVLFAFWNRKYWRASSGIHHFHFVMDMLNNYVPGKYKYSGYPADISEVYDFDNPPQVVIDITDDVKETDDVVIDIV